MSDTIITMSAKIKRAIRGKNDNKKVSHKK